MQLGFGTGILYGIATQDATGAAVSNATPVQFGTLQDISTDMSFEEKLLYGAYQFPIAVGRGKGKFSFKAKTASVSGLILSDLFFGLPSAAGIKAAVNNYAASVPGVSAYTITVVPPSSGTYVKDLGVTDATTGLPLKKMGSAPASGQYMVNETTGVYTFASLDANKAVFISYEYSATSSAGPKSVTINNQLMGYAPTFKALLSTSFQGKQLTLSLNSCVSSKFSLPFKNDDFAVPEFDFSAFADATGALGYISLSE